MKSNLPVWLWSHTRWIILALLVIAFFTGVVGSNAILPLSLIVVASGFAAFRYWDAIKSFDFWAFDEWVRARMDSMGVREWHSPYHAAEIYCSPATARARNEAAAEMNSIMMELIRGKDAVARVGDASSGVPDFRLERTDSARHHTSYDAAQARYNQCNVALARELLAQLARGDLIAKGLPVEGDAAKSERIIPTSRWRVMNLDISKAKASGLGLSYEGVIIGKKPSSGTTAPAAPAQPWAKRPQSADNDRPGNKERTDPRASKG
jgi:hypothetical protein